jgi:hypothetical protein
MRQIRSHHLSNLCLPTLVLMFLRYKARANGEQMRVEEYPDFTSYGMSLAPMSAFARLTDVQSQSQYVRGVADIGKP